MHQDQVEGNVKEVAGQVRVQTGNGMASIGEQQPRGHAREAEGKAQQAIGDLKKRGNDATKKPLTWVWRRQV